MPSAPSILILDKDRDARDELARLGASLGAKVVTFNAPQSLFVANFEVVTEGCIVADLLMTEMPPVEVMQTLLRRKITLPFIFLTHEPRIALVVDVLRMGAHTVLQKTAPGEQLAREIRAAFLEDRRRRAEFAAQEQILARVATLSGEEREVMDLIVAGERNKTIAHRMNLEMRTVERRRRQILHKMHVRSLAELVQVYVRHRLGRFAHFQGKPHGRLSDSRMACGQDVDDEKAY